MSVFKRGNKWCIGYSLNGRWVRKMIGPSKRVAEQVEREIRQQIIKKRYLGIVEPKKILFDELCKEYLEYAYNHKSETTFISDKSILKKLLKIFNGRLLEDITVLDVEKYKSQRTKEVSGSMVNREITCLKHMFNKAVDWNYLDDNHLRGIRKFKEPPGRVRYLSAEEENGLIQCCADHLRPIVVMALNTGMRRGEILNLKWEDIDLRNRKIFVKKTKNNEIRVIDINDTLYLELCSISRELSSQYVFANADGKPLRDVKRSFKTALKRAGIKGFRFHDLRHHFASRLAMLNVGFKTIQELMGHKDYKMTLRYAHLTDEHKKDAVRKLDYRTNTAQRLKGKSSVL